MYNCNVCICIFIVFNILTSLILYIIIHILYGDYHNNIYRIYLEKQGSYERLGQGFSIVK